MQAEHLRRIGTRGKFTLCHSISYDHERFRHDTVCSTGARGTSQRHLRSLIALLWNSVTPILRCLLKSVHALSPLEPLLVNDLTLRRRPAKQRVTIEIGDENDNGPYFDTNGIYRASVDENADVGAKVIDVTAKDIDDGECDA